MSQKNKVYWIDYELVWDVWSLAFCCLRMDEPSINNAAYPRVFFKEPSSFLSTSTLA